MVKAKLPDKPLFLQLVEYVHADGRCVWSRPADGLPWVREFRSAA